MRSRRSVRRQRGTVLVLFALIVVVLLALAALTIDLGLARLTQDQLQTAADAAAREGLRARDGDPETGAGWPYADSASADVARRTRVDELVQQHFDADGDLDSSEPLLGPQFGAGPVVELSGGDGSAVNAYQDLALPDPPLYKPDLEWNTDNEVHGDMLAGDYDPFADHTEDPDYRRADFDPAVGADAEATAASSLAADAFLVRLRRTHPDRDPLARDPGVASSGPELPFLFGRGALLSAPDPTAGYAPRHHGVTVRGTAVAEAKPALRVGRGDAALGLEGLLVLAPATAPGPDLVLERAFWDGLASGVAEALDPGDGSGVLRRAGAAVGLYPTDGSGAQAVGAVPTPLGSDPAAAGVDVTGFVPVYQDFAPHGLRVVGFGRVRVQGSVAGGLTLTKQPEAVAPRNATATAARGLPLMDIADPLVRGLILDANRLMTDPVLAPALVR